MLVKDWIQNLWESLVIQSRAARFRRRAQSKTRRRRSRPSIERLESRILLTTPAVVSFYNPDQAINSNASTSSWTVLFSEPVTGVDPTDFQLYEDATVAATLTQVTPVSGSEYRVTVSGISGKGALGVDLVNDDSIRSLSFVGLGGNVGLEGTPQGNVRYPGNRVTVDTVAVFDGLGSDLAYQNSGSTISANWIGFSDHGSGIASYQWAIGTTPGGTDVQAFTGVENATNASNSALNLNNGTKYYVTVKAIDASGNVGNMVSSNGVTVDTVAPSAGTVSDAINADIVYQKSATSISAYFIGFSDSGTGVDHYEWAIGTTPGGTDVQAFTGVFSRFSASPSNNSLALTNGTTYYVTAKAIDAAGNASDAVSSNGVTVDSVAPATGTVSDGFGSDLAYQNSTSMISANWTGFSDHGSGIASYQWAIGTTPGGTDVQVFTSLGSVTNVSSGALSLTNAKTYYVTVKAIDGVGNVSNTVSSNGVTVDTIAPLVVSMNRTTPASATSNAHSVSFTATFSEPVTGVTSSAFSLAVTGTVGASAISVIPVSSSVYTVNVTGITGDGSLGLNLVDSGNIHDLAGNGLVTPDSPASFANQVTFATGASPRSGTLVDVNGDGKADLIVANSGSNSVSVLLGNGNGTFQTPATFATESAPWSVAVGDVNGDGKSDLIVANSGSNNVSVLLGNGNGTFQAGTKFATGALPSSVAVGDVNGDGKTDLIVANRGGNVSVLLGNGNGTFQTQATFATSSYIPWSVALGDVNGDGKTDLIVADFGSNSVSVLLGNGNGTFQAWRKFATGRDPMSVAVGDVNGDGKTDLIVANSRSNDVSVLLGNGNGTFQTQATFATGASPRSVAVGDVNGDGKSDLIVANSGSNNVSVLLGNGNGTFQTQATFATGSFPVSVRVGDVDGDGKFDLVVANNSSGTVSVLLGNANGGFNGQVFSIDQTAPAAGTVNDGFGADIAYQDSTSTISANWTGFSDSGSGIASYQWAIGTSAGGTDVQAFSSVGTAVSATNSSLTLTNGTKYYVTVEAIDAAGNVSNTVSSNGVTITDDDAPTLVGTSALIFTEKQAARAINSAVVIGDADNTTLASATVRISANYFASEDVLAFVAGTTTGNVAGSFDSTTGTLTLTSDGSTATLAQFQAALRLVTYRNLSASPSTAARSVDYQVFDGVSPSNTVTSLMTVIPVDDAPVIAGASVLSYTEAQPVTPINTTITVSDTDNVTLVSATVKIATYVATEDVLGFVNNPATMGNITGRFNAGTLTLTSTGAAATAAQFQAALQAVTYTNLSFNPTTTARTVTYQVSDGTLLSNTIVRTINLSTVNTAPTLTGASALVYAKGQAATNMNAAVVVADADNTTLASATVRISANYSAGEDVLGFVAGTTTGNITSSFDSTSGTLTLTSAGSSASLAQFQAALRLVKYSDTNVTTPSTAPRSIQFQVNDGGSVNFLSNTVTSLITIKGTGAAPVVTGTNSLTYSEQAHTVLAINPSLTVTDADSGTLAWATVKVSANYSPTQDVLGFLGDSTTGNISGSFNPTTGSLTLISEGMSATTTQFQAALQRVTYLNKSANPTVLARSVQYQVSDGTNPSLINAGNTSTIAVTTYNDPPTLVGVNALIYREKKVATAINATVFVGDVDNTTLASATVTISDNYVDGQDVLGFVPGATTGNITGSFASGTLTLTSAGSTATLGQFQAALRLVTYLNTSSNPSAAIRSVNYWVNDGTNSSNVATSQITIVAADDAPTLSGTSTLAYTEKQQPTPINSSMTVGDLDNSTLVSATVKVATYVATEDVLGFVGDATTGNIVGSFSAGTLTLTSAGATATVAQFQAALRLVTYANINSKPTTTARTVTYQVSDGTLLSSAVLSTITIIPVNDAPTLSGVSTLIYIKGAAATAIDGALIVADVDNANLVSATVQISTNYRSSEDVLSFATTGNIQGVFNSTTGTMTLSLISPTVATTAAQFQAALRLVKYSNSNSTTPSTAPRSIQFQVNDGSTINNLSNLLTSLITIKGTGSAPVIAGGASTLTYAEKQPVTAINPNLTVSDVDSATLAFATVKILGSFKAKEDLLEFVGDGTTGNVTGSYNSTTGIMTLISEGATATTAQFQAALRLVTYRNLSSNMTKLARSIQYQVSDGSNLSNVVTSTVNFN